ncbi:MAG: FecR domain-containing protein [Bacteroidales bacterium]|nr:FecR domain-containing protein [Bacteroidales bacterium]
MNIRKFENYHSTEDFILDKEFTHWVLNPERYPENVLNSLVSAYPEKEEFIRDASLIIASMQPRHPEVPELRLDEILQKVKATEQNHSTRNLNYLKYAAGIAVLIGLGTSLYFSVLNTKPFRIEAASDEAFLKGKIILADGSIKEYDTKEIAISQNSSESLIINNDTINLESNKKENALNQVIIPYGKSSKIILADGSHIWLNAGSRLSYPSEFRGNSREIYLTGEAFFEVSHNPSKPFYVITPEIKIRVIGTSFNVSAYPDEQTVQTVLVSGKVTAGKNKLLAGTIDLVPGERLTYDKSTTDLSKDKVDINNHSSWKDGYLLFNNAPCSHVFLKLERYYNKDIRYEESFEKASFSGKLVLKDNLMEVLNNIAFASSLIIEDQNGILYIKNDDKINQ